MANTLHEIGSSVYAWVGGVWLPATIDRGPEAHPVPLGIRGALGTRPRSELGPKFVELASFYLVNFGTYLEWVEWNNIRATRPTSVGGPR